MADTWTLQYYAEEDTWKINRAKLKEAQCSAAMHQDNTSAVMVKVTERCVRTNREDFNKVLTFVPHLRRSAAVRNAL